MVLEVIHLWRTMWSPLRWLRPVAKARQLGHGLCLNPPSSSQALRCSGTFLAQSDGARQSVHTMQPVSFIEQPNFNLASCQP